MVISENYYIFIVLNYKEFLPIQSIRFNCILVRMLKFRCGYAIHVHKFKT